MKKSELKQMVKEELLKEARETKAPKQKMIVAFKRSDFKHEGFWNDLIDTFEIPTGEAAFWEEVDMLTIVTNKVTYE